jgi:hypothetical protein
VTARVVRDTVSQDGEVVEDTFDWYAQDSGGTVWYLGEDTAGFEDGEVLSLQEMADVPAGHFDDLLLTKDTDAREPDVLEYRLYAVGVGPVLTLGVSGGGGAQPSRQAGGPRRTRRA